MRSTLKCVALVALFVAAVFFVSLNVAFAHHAAAGLFSPDVVKTINGTVKRWNFVNPHPALILDIKTTEGTVEEWRVEFAAVRQLSANHGWTRNTMKPGDEVKIFGYPYFGGQKTMFAVRVTLPSGKEYVVRSPRDAERQ
jgi:Family of unknown function (DUF6152)